MSEVHRKESCNVTATRALHSSPEDVDAHGVENLASEPVAENGGFGEEA